MVPRVKDLVWSLLWLMLLWLMLLLWHTCDHWLQEIPCASGVAKKKKIIHAIIFDRELTSVIKLTLVKQQVPMLQLRGPQRANTRVPGRKGGSVQACL